MLETLALDFFSVFIFSSLGEGPERRPAPSVEM